jgi:DMSO/TMAO reductase YedYZ molybdopterin-dependent catalytic subunit
LLYGLLWSSFGVGGIDIPGLGWQTGLGMHAALAIGLLPLLIRHAVERWPQVRLRRPDFASRRAAIRYLALGTAGVLGWRATEAAAAGADLPGSRRRFTGSQETGSLSGNDFPTTSWMTDTEPQLDPASWQLRVHGAVARETVIGWDELAGEAATTVRATLDCTGGWYTEQDWTGVPVAALLQWAGVRSSARSLVFHSATGYRRRYPLSEAGQLMLATHVSGEALAAGHGYPVRLVAPGRRGYDWVKWVVALEVSDLPSWLESPLPLQ